MSVGVSFVNVTPCLQKGVAIINNADSQKFLLLLNRIGQSLQSDKDATKPFSDEEQEKLLVTFSVDQADLSLMLDSAVLILTQAAYHIMKPALLQKQLMDVLKMDEEKATIFVKIWTSHAKGIVSRLKQKSVAPKQLEGVSWMLNLTTASSTAEGTQLLEPNATVELKVKHNDENTGNIVLDMNQSELYRFYSTLEEIQSELDALQQ